MMMVRNGAAVCRTGLSVSAALDGTPEYSCVIIASSSFAGAAEEAQGRLPEVAAWRPGTSFEPVLRQVAQVNLSRCSAGRRLVRPRAIR